MKYLLVKEYVLNCKLCDLSPIFGCACESRDKYYFKQEHEYGFNIAEIRQFSSEVLEEETKSKIEGNIPLFQFSHLPAGIYCDLFYYFKNELYKIDSMEELFEFLNN